MKLNFEINEFENINKTTIFSAHDILISHIT